MHNKAQPLLMSVYSLSLSLSRMVSSRHQEWLWPNGYKMPNKTYSQQLPCSLGHGLPCITVMEWWGHSPGQVVLPLCSTFNWGKKWLIYIYASWNHVYTMSHWQVPPILSYLNWRQCDCVILIVNTDSYSRVWQQTLQHLCL